MESPFVHEWVFGHAERTPDAPAVATPTVRLTYAALAERTRALAAHLADRGVEPGDRVLVALPSTPAAVVAALGIQARGAVPVEVNREWSPEVLAGIAAQARVRHAVIWGRDAAAWSPERAGAGVSTFVVLHPGSLEGRIREALGGAPASALRDDGRLAPEITVPPFRPAAAPPRDAPALVLYTSGSTGRPRGVMQTAANVDANTRSIVQYLGLGAEDRALLVLPLYYCYGRSVLQTHLLAGGSVFLDGRFAFPRVVLEAFATEGITGFAGVPLTFELVRRQVDVASMRFPRLRYVTQAGGAMARETIRWVREAFAPARLFVMYGQTEATARLSYLPPERAAEKEGSIGIPIPGVELQVVDDAGRALPAREVGHLVARGANVTAGYLEEPEATRAILHDGWLWTGDLAMRDEDGFFFHRGRSKEILKIGGHRVSPVEIEHVVALHPEVAEAAVVGEAEPLMGEVPVAYVVARSGAALADADLRRFCRARLPPYEVPVRFVTVDALPRNEAGKLLRSELARRAGRSA